jgi:hypothetical protein
MFSIEVRVILLGRDGMMGLSRSIQLPFVPYPGLELLGLAGDPACPEMVEEVTWDLGLGCFYASLEDWEESRLGIAEMIDHFGPGWELKEPGQVSEGTE